MPELLECAADLFAYRNSGAVCDGRHVRFVDPCGLVVFSCVADTFRNTGVPLKLKEFSTDLLTYISRMDAFAGFIPEGTELSQRRDRRDVLVEVTKVQGGHDTEDTARRLATAMVGHIPDLQVDEEPDEMTGMSIQDRLLEPLEYIFSELLDNVFQHARTPVFDQAYAWVSAQYAPKTDKIRLAIADNGCGFLYALREHPNLVEKTDAGAINLALQERMSSNPALLLMGSGTSTNQGVGLTIVSKIAQRANGRMWVASGSAIVEAVRKSVRWVSASWQGSILSLELERKPLMNIRIHQIVGTLEGVRGKAGLDFT